MSLINSIHSKEPPILEINETPDPFGEIFFPNQNEILSKKPEINLPKIFSALQEGISNLLELSLNPLINFLNTWSQNIVKNLIDNNLIMRRDLIDLKNNLSQGISNLQNNFKFSLTGKLNDLGIYVDDKLEDFDKEHEIITEMITQFKLEFNQLIDTLFQEKIKDTLDNLLNFIEKTSQDLTEIDQKITNSSENLEYQNSFKDLSERIISIENKTLEELGIRREKFKGTFLEGINNMNSSLNDINNQINNFFRDLDEILSNLKSSKDLLREKIKTLEKDKKELSNELKKQKT